MKSWLMALVLLSSSCGRIGFDRQNEAGAIDAALIDAAVLPDASGLERRVWMGVQGVVDSYVVALLWDADAALPAQLAEPVLRLDLMSGGGLRGLTALDADRLLANSGLVPEGVAVAQEGLAELGSVQMVEGSMSNAHGACQLPGGNVILGEFSVGSGNGVEEFSLSANGDLTLVRSVYTTSVNRGVLTECQAISDTEIYLVENDATGDSDGDVVRLTRNAGVWSESSRLDTSVFAEGVGAQTTGIWGFGIVADQLFAFPIRRNTGRLSKLMRCDLPGLDNCLELGALPPDPVSTSDDPDLIQGVSALPGTRQILFSTNRKLFRYDLDSNLYQEIFDLTSLALVDRNGQPDSIKALRDVVVR